MNLRDLYTKYNSVTADVVDELMKSSAIFQSATYVPSNSGIEHKIQKLKTLPTGTIGGVGDGFTATAKESEMTTFKLAWFRALNQISTAYASVYPGGVQGYFRDQAPSFMESLKQDAMANIIYGTDPTGGSVAGTEGLRQFAEKNSKSIAAGGTTDTTSIIAVRWNPEFTSLLVNPNLSSDGNFLKVSPLSKGEEHSYVDSNSAIQTGYEVARIGQMGLMCASDDSVSIIKGIDSSNVITASNMNALCNNVKFHRGGAIIYCNMTGWQQIMDLKAGKLQMLPANENYSTLVGSWNGVPILLEENINDTESATIVTV